jgi:hypothetical protein
VGSRINAPAVREQGAGARHVRARGARTGPSHVSLKTTIPPQQLADTMLFLCSPRGRTISGQAISVCGDLQMLA